jgi:hypothetical protein
LALSIGSAAATQPVDAVEVRVDQIILDVVLRSSDGLSTSKGALAAAKENVP